MIAERRNRLPPRFGILCVLCLLREKLLGRHFLWEDGAATPWNAPVFRCFVAVPVLFSGVMIQPRQAPAPDEVAAHYDELDFFYRDVWGEHVHHGLWRTGRESRAEAVRQLVQLVATEAELRAGERLCDIGCGYGATARMLAREPGAEVTAITVSPMQHAFAQKSTAGGNPVFVLGDWLKNRLPDDFFAAAVAIESSEHMPSLPAFFREAWRVLQPGGRLVVCAWLSREAPGDLERRWLLEPICREGRMPQMGTAREYEQIAASAGFVPVRYQDLSRQVSSTWPRIAWTFLRKLVVNPRYLRFLCNAHARNRIFALTILRLSIAYRTSSMRYGVFTFTKGSRSAQPS